MVAARLSFPSGTDSGDDLVGTLTASCPRSLLAAFLVPASPPPPALSGEVPQSLLLSPCGAPVLSSFLPSTFRAAGRMRLARFGSWSSPFRTARRPAKDGYNRGPRN